jgi:hypothetical protein
VSSEALAKATAVALDPNFAEAYLSVAFAHQQQVFSWEGGKDDDEKATMALDKAISLNPNLADAYVVRGALYYNHLHDFDIVNSVANFRKAILRKRQVLIRSKTRSPERVQESRAFQLTSDLHGCRSSDIKMATDQSEFHESKILQSSQPSRPSGICVAFQTSLTSLMSGSRLLYSISISSPFGENGIHKRPLSKCSDGEFSISVALVSQYKKTCE